MYLVFLSVALLFQKAAMRGHSVGQLETCKQKRKRQCRENPSWNLSFAIKEDVCSQTGSRSHNLQFTYLDFLDKVDSMKASI